MQCRCARQPYCPLMLHLASFACRASRAWPRPAAPLHLAATGTLAPSSPSPSPSPSPFPIEPADQSSTPPRLQPTHLMPTGRSEFSKGLLEAAAAAAAASFAPASDSWLRNCHQTAEPSDAPHTIAPQRRSLWTSPVPIEISFCWHGCAIGGCLH